MTLTSGGGTIARRQAQCIDARAVAGCRQSPSAVTITGVPGGTDRDEKSVNGSWMSVTALVKIVS